MLGTMINASSFDTIRIEVVGEARAITATGSEWVGFRDENQLVQGMKDGVAQRIADIEAERDKAFDTINGLKKQIGMAKALRGLPLDQDITDEQVKANRADTFRWLVLWAWKHAEISIGRAAELLGTDIVSFREMANKEGVAQY